MMKKNQILTSLLVFFVCFSIGSFGTVIYLHRECGEMREQLKQKKAPESVHIQRAEVVVEASHRPEKSSEDVKALNAYVDKLEKEKQALDQQLEASYRQNDQGGRGGRVGRQSMEELKESNPEEYKRRMAMRERMQKAMEEQRQRRKDYFASLDMSNMNEEQKTLLADYQTLLDGMDSMRNGEGGGDRREMFETMRAVGEMREEVQKVLLEQLGNKIGVNGESLAEGVNEILHVMGGGFGGFGGRRPPASSRQ